MRGLATSMEHIFITIISQRMNDLFHMLSVWSSFYMKLTLGTSVIGGNLLKMKLYFTFDILVSLKYD